MAVCGYSVSLRCVLRIRRGQIPRDVETTGLPRRSASARFPPPHDPASYAGARIVQMAWQLVDLSTGTVMCEDSFLVLPSGVWVMSSGAEQTHGLSRPKLEQEGRSLPECLSAGGFWDAVGRARMLVAHNLEFDYSVLLSEVLHDPSMRGCAPRLSGVPRHCTMRQTTNMCALPFPNSSGGRPGQYKWPKLIELHRLLFDGRGFDGVHDALEDVRATTRCLLELRKRDRRIGETRIKKHVSAQSNITRG